MVLGGKIDCAGLAGTRGYRSRRRTQRELELGARGHRRGRNVGDRLRRATGVECQGGRGAQGAAAGRQVEARREVTTRNLDGYRPRATSAACTGHDDDVVALTDL